jgi:hypothetical protein
MSNPRTWSKFPDLAGQRAIEAALEIVNDRLPRQHLGEAGRSDWVDVRALSFGEDGSIVLSVSERGIPDINNVIATLEKKGNRRILTQVVSNLPERHYVLELSNKQWILTYTYGKAAPSQDARAFVAKLIKWANRNRIVLAFRHAEGGIDPPW